MKVYMTVRASALFLFLVITFLLFPSPPVVADETQWDNVDGTLESVQSLDLKLPFEPGQEWVITNGWTGHANGPYPAWNLWAMDFHPVASDCLGKAVLASGAGIIEKLDSGSGQVLINHETEELRTNYVHLDSFAAGLVEGSRVYQGQKLGVCGNKGISFGDHIHFQVIKGNPNVSNTGYRAPIQGYDNLETGKKLYSTNYGYSGVYVAQDFQPVMIAGETQSVQLQIKNMGAKTWDNATRIVALPRSGDNPFYDVSWMAPNRIVGAQPTTPGSVATFNFTVKAPLSPGVYQIDFAMVQEGITWFTSPSDGFIWFRITVAPPVGEGSSRKSLFLDAFNRNGGFNSIGYPLAGAQWSGPQNAPVQAVIQGLSSGAFIIHDEQRDSPIGSVPAYVLNGPILRHFQSLAGSSSWLGAGPTSDQFTNASGHQQSNFPSGYITYDGASANAYKWPVREADKWHAEYHNGQNLNAGPTWVQNEAGVNYDWSNNAPGDGRWGVWSENFSVRWTKKVILSDGRYNFTVQTGNKALIWLNGQLIIDTSTGQKEAVQILPKGEYNLQVDYYETGGSASIAFDFRLNEYKAFLPVIRR